MEHTLENWEDSPSPRETKTGTISIERLAQGMLNQVRMV